MTSEKDDTVPQEQVETTLQFLETCHGLALQANQSGQAHAYYHAITMLEDALNDELRAPDDVSVDEDSIERSRRARDAGFKEATLLEQEKRGRPSEPPSVVQRLRSLFSWVRNLR
jgi:hypothetical protein